LYIVKKATEKLNGSITLDTNVGIGSIFTITLPINHSEKTGRW
jgi:signal transduction histidine kinase